MSDHPETKITPEMWAKIEILRHTNAEARELWHRITQANLDRFQEYLDWLKERRRRKLEDLP